MKQYQWEKVNQALKKWLEEDCLSYDEIRVLLSKVEGFEDISKKNIIHYSNRHNYEYKFKYNELCWRDEDILVVKNLISQGKSYREISEEINKDFKSINRLANRLGLKYAPKYRNISLEPDLIDIKYFIEVAEYTYAEVGKLYGRDMYLIRHFCKKHGIETKRKTERTEEEKNQIISLSEQGYTYSEIDEKIGRPKGSSSNFIRKNNIGYKHHRVVREITEEEIEKAIQLYYIGNSIVDIAKELSIPEDIVRRRIYRKYKDRFKRISKLEEAKLGLFLGKYTGMDYDTLVELSQVKKFSSVKIAEMFGMCDKIVRDRLKLLGLLTAVQENHRQNCLSIVKAVYGRDYLLPEEENVYPETLIPKDYLENLLKKFKYSYKKCARYMGITDTILYTAVRNLKIEVLHKRKVSDLGLDYYVDLLENGYNVFDISEITGFCTVSLREFFKSNIEDYEKKYRTIRYIGEKRVAEVLESFNIEFEHNKYFPVSFVDIDQESIFIDFVFIYNGILYWIEYNGKQHYIEKDFKKFNREYRPFEYQVKRDLYVKKMAKEAGAVFLEIPYTYITLSEIQDLLQRVIIEGEDINNIIDYTPFYKEIEELGIGIEDDKSESE